MTATLALAALLAPAPQPQLGDLKPRLDAMARTFGGRLGYRVELLEDPAHAIGFRETERFPSASTIKTVVMIEVVRQIEAGKMKWTDTLPIPPVAQRNMSLWVGHLIEGKKMNLEGLVYAMMSVSDNTATVMLANHVGVENIERTMLSWGFQDTVCTINVPASNERLIRLRRSFLNMGVTTPRDMNGILRRLVTGNAATSRAATERMVRIMGQQYWDDFVGWGVPPHIQVAGKVGALNRSRSEAAIVFGPRPYLISIYTDNQTDRKWVDENEGNEAIRRMSNLVWNHLNPTQTYAPPTDAPRWFPTGAGLE